MSTLKTVTLAAALIAGATSLAMAQNAPAAGGANGNNGMPPKDYKGPGAMPAYSSSEFQGHPALYNQAPGGNQASSGANGMPPKDYKGPGAMPAYSSSEFQGHPALYNQAPGGNQASSGANGNNGMPPQSYKGPGAMSDYSPSEFQGK
jgi:hypothetical protein